MNQEPKLSNRRRKSPDLSGRAISEEQTAYEAPRPQIHTRGRQGLKPHMEFDIENEKFIVNHAYIGSQTVQEVFEDFLHRAIKNS